MQTPQHPQLEDALRILHYLKGSPGKGIFFFFYHPLIRYDSCLMLIQIGQVVLIPTVLQVAIVLFLNSVQPLGKPRSKI